MSDKVIPDKIFFCVGEGCGEDRFLVIPSSYVAEHVWLNSCNWEKAQEYFNSIAVREGYTHCLVLPDNIWQENWSQHEKIEIAP